MSFLVEVREAIQAVESHDLTVATVDELIDTKRQLEQLLRDIESHIHARKESGNAK